MARESTTTMPGSAKAAAMLDLWASAKRAARDRLPENRDEPSEVEAEPKGRAGAPPDGLPAPAAE